MGNPIVHALVFAAAVLIPGGLLVYFAWRAISLKARPNQNSDSEQLEHIPEKYRKTIDNIFIWSGNSNVFPAIIK